MYQEFYGLTEQRFDITPNPRFLFYSAKHREAFNHLSYGIRARKGFVPPTSGDYERFFISNGKRYHHILSPKTGRPADQCRSVTVIAPEGYLADSFSPGIFILGPEKGITLVETLGYNGVIVDSTGKIHMTPNLRGKIEFQGKS